MTAFHPLFALSCARLNVQTTAGPNKEDGIPLGRLLHFVEKGFDDCQEEILPHPLADALR